MHTYVLLYSRGRKARPRPLQRSRVSADPFATKLKELWVHSVFMHSGVFCIESAGQRRVRCPCVQGVVFSVCESDGRSSLNFLLMVHGARGWGLGPGAAAWQAVGVERGEAAAMSPKTEYIGAI